MSTNSPLHVLVILASTRPGRLGPAITQWFIDATRGDAQQAGVSLEVADLAHINLPLLDEPEHPSSGQYTHEHTKAWSRQVAAADAFIVVTPEYNYGMPAPLKNAIDYLYNEWAWKPVGFISYGNTSAGTRSVQMAKQVITTLRMVPIGATVALRIADNIDEGKVRQNPDLDDSACRVLRELCRVAHALRPLREDIDKPLSAGPVDGIALAAAGHNDLAELLVLQRCCWVQEAIANNTLNIAPLHETLEDVQAWTNSWQTWCVRRHGRLVAAVRARASGTLWEIGRLMVAPDQTGNGIGSWLLAHAEQQAPEDTTEIALSTGRHSHRNIDLYQRAGYTVSTASRSSAANDNVHLTKQLESSH